MQLVQSVGEGFMRVRNMLLVWWTGESLKYGFSIEGW
jgi:hypothetical protein